MREDFALEFAGDESISHAGERLRVRPRAISQASAVCLIGM
jgi:hypothetical protein